MKKQNIKLKPHHLMCVHGFKGHGYSPQYVENFWSILRGLKDTDSIEVTTGMDSICNPCPNNHKTFCSFEPKIKRLDQAYLNTLKIEDGQILSWKEVKKTVAEKVEFAAFEKNCDPCEWKKLGVCREALSNLKKDHEQHTSLRSFAILAAFFFSFNLLAQTASQIEPAPVKLPEISKEIKLEEPPQTITEKVEPTTVQSEADKEDLSRVFTQSVDPKSIEEIEKEILLDKSKRISGFSKISQLLEKKNYKLLLELTKGLEANKDFSDYIYFLRSQAYLALTQEALKSSNVALALKNGQKAVDLAKEALTTNPFSALHRRSIALLGEAQVWFGETLLKQKKTKQATESYEEGFAHLSSIRFLSVVPKKLILNYANLCKKTKTELCLSWLSKLSPLVSKTEEGKILEKIAAFRKPIIDRPMAQVAYKVDLDLQQFQKGYILYLDSKYEEAFIVWRDLLKDYPKTTIRLRTTFWMARCAQKAGFDAQAETLYRQVIHDLPFSYYALLSSWFSGIDLARMMNLELPMAVTQVENLAPEDLNHLKKAEKFIASNAPEFAAIELSEVNNLTNTSNEFLVYLAALNHLSGNHLAAFKIFGELSSRGYIGLFSSYGQKILFPTARLPLIRELAKEHNVDPIVVLSVIKQESAFKPDAVSGSNAFGLMQIIPPTARDLDPRAEVVNLFEPQYNIKLGSKYIAQLLGRYKGDLISTLAAYNAGPGNSDRWLREGRVGLPPEEYIESIGFRETREYVQNILRNIYWYNRRIKNDQAPNIRSLLNYIVPVPGPKQVQQLSKNSSVSAKRKPAAQRKSRGFTLNSRSSKHR